jgi:hypothetical protein
MPRSPEQQLLRVALSGALAALLIGGLLWMTRALVPVPLAPAAADAAPAALSERAAPAAQGRAAPLPTIAQRRLMSSAVVPTASTPLPPPALPTASAGGGGVTATAASATDAAFTTRLAQHLACLAPRAQHDRALDARAMELARQDDTPIPPTGAVQIAGPDAQRILLSADMLAELYAADGRCGETLIFGIPPLEWLPQNARFGLGIATRAGGAVVVVVTR